MRFLSLVPPVLVFAIGAAALVLFQPACLTHCEALAGCANDEKEVEECPKGATCHEVELCGNTALCTKDPSCADPACVDGAIDVAVCATDATCTMVVKCGQTHVCQAAKCAHTGDCASDEYCHFRDGLCGNQRGGECLPRPTMCPAGPETACFCDGTVGQPCAGLNGADFDVTGTSCPPPPTAIRCGQLFCDGGTVDYCLLLGNTDAANNAECGGPTEGCDPAQCACLGDVIANCKCIDGPNGPTISCSN